LPALVIGRVDTRQRQLRIPEEETRDNFCRLRVRLIQRVEQLLDLFQMDAAQRLQVEYIFKIF
jgi:hypothetical protein